MAEQSEIDAIKAQLPDDADTAYGWDDAYISAMIDSGISENLIFATFWEKVAAETASLVDMSESGSSRSLSQVHKNAVSMAKWYRDRDAQESIPPATSDRFIISRQMRRV